MLAATIGWLVALCGCAEQSTNNLAPPAKAEAVKTERPATKTGTLSLEGNDDPFTFRLFDAASASVPAPFTTYVPEDMIADIVGTDSGKTVRFVANFGGRRQEQAYLEVAFFPPATSESEARSVIEKTGPGGASLKLSSDGSKRFTWSLAEYGISYTSKTGRMTGAIALGKHGDRLFRLTLHYPEEFGDGFMPRASRILEEWRWSDNNLAL
jgi:hypothetical protein